MPGWPGRVTSVQLERVHGTPCSSTNRIQTSVRACFASPTLLSLRVPAAPLRVNHCTSTGSWVPCVPLKGTKVSSSQGLSSSSLTRLCASRAFDTRQRPPYRPLRLSAATMPALVCPLARPFESDARFVHGSQSPRLGCLVVGVGEHLLLSLRQLLRSEPHIFIVHYLRRELQ